MKKTGHECYPQLKIPPRPIKEGGHFQNLYILVAFVEYIDLPEKGDSNKEEKKKEVIMK